jgi:MFS family permease
MQLDQNSIYSKTWIKDLLVTLVMFLMIFVSWLASRFYRRRFGWLDPTWITLPTNLFYWSIVLCFLIWSLYALILLQFFGSLPYWLTIIWISPLFNEENPPIRRIYFALAGTVVISSTLFIQLTHRNNTLILVIQCVVLLALGVADHLLLMSLCTPPREDAHA